MVEQGFHVAAEGLVVVVDGGPVRGCAAFSWCSDAGGERRENLVAEDEERGDSSRGDLEDVVAAGAAGFDDE